MTAHTPTLATITVPVGFGGKTTPYVPDPAPTLLVELATVVRQNEESRVAARLEEADAAGRARIAAAEDTAATLLAAAEETAASVIATARADAEALLRAAQDDADVLTQAAEEAAAAADEAQDALEARRCELDARETDLMARETHLIDRLAAADSDAAEATAVLAAARTEADMFLADARETAEEILEDARREAADEATALLADARLVAENDPTIAERISEIESVHRIEVQVLHDREAALLERVAALEARLAGGADGGVLVADESPDKPREHAAAGATLAVELDDDEVTVRSDPRPNGRHTTEVRTTEVRTPEHATAGPVASHAPLTEQLSTSAFRSVPENDRRGRRRR